MKGLETGKDRVKKICDTLRKETLEPAKQEAQEIIDKAREEAARIKAEAERKAEEILLEAKNDIDRQKTIFQSSMQQAWRQTIEQLKQQIETKLFNPELSSLISQQTRDPKVIAQLINAVVQAIEKEGLSADLSVSVPASVPPDTINKLIMGNIIDKLRERGVIISTINGGITVKLHKENITIDLSDTALTEMVASFIRKDFRDWIFGTK